MREDLPVHILHNATVSDWDRVQHTHHAEQLVTTSERGQKAPWNGGSYADTTQTYWPGFPEAELGALSHTLSLSAPPHPHISTTRRYDSGRTEEVHVAAVPRERPVFLRGEQYGLGLSSLWRQN